MLLATDPLWNVTVLLGTEKPVVHEYGVEEFGLRTVAKEGKGVRKRAR